MINILELLKNKPQGTKLYSTAIGECVLLDTNCNIISVRDEKETDYSFDVFGIFINTKGECVLFPSKDMRDWKKIAWKRGDVLSCGDSTLVFKEWANDSYTRFCGVHEIVQGKVIRQYIDSEAEYATCEYDKETDSENVEQYLRDVEYDTVGKLNLKTLEIERTGAKFKDGDIVYVETKDNYKIITIFQRFLSKKRPAVYMNLFLDEGKVRFADKYDGYNILCDWEEITEIRLATEEEKELILSKLANIGKKWNPDTKMIENIASVHDVSPSCFKPMDWCLMRMHRCIWRLCQYSSPSGEKWSCPHIAVGGNAYEECIPYNEETKHLLGTSDEWGMDEDIICCKCKNRNACNSPFNNNAIKCSNYVVNTTD